MDRNKYYGGDSASMTPIDQVSVNVVMFVLKSQVENYFVSTTFCF